MPQYFNLTDLTGFVAICNKPNDISEFANNLTTNDRQLRDHIV